MTVKTPAELKTLYESISFDLQTTYTGPLGQEYAVSGHPSAPVGTHGAEGGGQPLPQRAAAVSP